MLLSAVRERLGPDAVRTGARLDDVEQTPGGVRARLTDRRTSTEVEADVLVGADGVHSTVRSRLRPGEGPLPGSAADWNRAGWSWDWLDVPSLIRYGTPNAGGRAVCASRSG